MGLVNRQDAKGAKAKETERLVRSETLFFFLSGDLCALAVKFLNSPSLSQK